MGNFPSFTAYIVDDDIISANSTSQTNSSCIAHRGMCDENIEDQEPRSVMLWSGRDRELSSRASLLRGGGGGGGSASNVIVSYFVRKGIALFSSFSAMLQSLNPLWIWS